MRARATKGKRGTATTALLARLAGHVTLDTRPDGTVIAAFHGHELDLGRLSAAAADRARDLQSGLPLDALSAHGAAVEQELNGLLRRLAAHGLLEYALRRSRARADDVVIEPQMPDYWPRLSPLGAADVLALSRFAYLRRRGNDMVLESPRAGALFRIGNPAIAAALAALSTPRQVKSLRRGDGVPLRELLALLLNCGMLFKVDPARSALRPDEGDEALVLWDFHDLLFHARSTQGRHANPSGGVYPYAGMIAPPPALRPHWPGRRIDLRESTAPPSQQASSLAALLRQRHSTRDFDAARPITLAELARFLETSARVTAQWQSKLELGHGDDAPAVDYAARPYPSGGASYPLELYLAVDKCEGLARGFYHYDAGEHALTPIEGRASDLDALLLGAVFAMDAPAAPQVLITIAARFGRASWKYSSLAYALILKDAGVLLQTLYLTATEMGLGGCAIGTSDIEVFARITGIEFHVEGPVAQFALGRGTPSAAST